MKNKIIILAITVVIVLAVLYCFLFFLEKQKNNNTSETLTLSEIMEMVKTDKDYNEFLAAVKGFNPELVNYTKLGLKEYQEKLKPEWEKIGLGDRNKIIDQINLTNSTYWVELKDKTDKNKGLLAILDIKEKKSLLLIASILMKVDVGN